MNKLNFPTRLTLNIHGDTGEAAKLFEVGSTVVFRVVEVHWQDFDPTVVLEMRDNDDRCSCGAKLGDGGDCPSCNPEAFR
jgi:hypothetical protein